MCFLFFKQKTAYEMRISDWSSDVCSSDLLGAGLFVPARVAVVGGQHIRQHLDVTAGGARIAARDVGLVVTVPFDAVVGIDLQRLVALAQALDRLRVRAGGRQTGERQGAGQGQGKGKRRRQPWKPAHCRSSCGRWAPSGSARWSCASG